MLSSVVEGGNYNQDFSTGIGAASLRGAAIVDGQSMRLTDNTLSQQGSLVIDDLDPGNAVQGFAVSFDMAIGPASNPPADGVSISFGAPPSVTGSFGEGGTPTGLGLVFDIFQNAGESPPSPVLRVRVNRTQIASAPVNAISGGGFKSVTVSYGASGLSLSYDNQQMLSNLALPGFTPATGYRFTFGARTGGFSAVQRIDNVSITTFGSFPTISGVTPSPVPGSNSPQSFVINGTNFDANCTVTLRNLSTGITYPNRTKIAQTATSITLNPNFGTPAHIWSVEVINPGSLSSGQTQFSVVAPVAPAIVASPQAAVVTAGGGATFTIQASGFPAPTYQWRLNGANILGATGSTLTINNVQLANAGNYTVVVSNSAGHVTSTPATLTVHSNLGSISTPIQPIYPDVPSINGGKDSLVVVTHGWEPLILFGPPPLAQWVTDMANGIQAHLTSSGRSNWSVLTYNWIGDTHRSGAYQLIPDTALSFAENWGRDLGKQIVTGGWNDVHLIAHSAGSALIEEASRIVKESSPTTVIHTTFLDPYTGATDDRRARYGQHSDWSENYFTFSTDTKDQWAVFGRRTFGRLPNAHNVDVTGLDPNKTYLDVAKSSSPIPDFVPVSTHGWPYQFYTQTIPTNLFAGGQGYGFPLSKEGGGWTNRTSYPRGNVPVILGGTNGIHQGTVPITSSGSLDLANLPHAVSSTGSVQYGGGSFTASTGGTQFTPQALATQASAPTGAPAWTSIAVELISAVNYVSFDAEFSSAAGAVGLLSVFWNDEKIGEIDERNVLPGIQNYFFEVDGGYTDRNNSLGFRLDQFSEVISTVSVTNVTTGYGGVTGPMSLALDRFPANPAPILTLTGLTNYTYLIEASEDLLNWEPIAAVTLDVGVSASFDDPDAHLFSQRFYRAVSP